MLELNINGSSITCKHHINRTISSVQTNIFNYVAHTLSEIHFILLGDFADIIATRIELHNYGDDDICISLLKLCIFVFKMFVRTPSISNFLLQLIKHFMLLCKHRSFVQQYAEAWSILLIVYAIISVFTDCISI